MNTSRDESVKTGDESVETRDESIETREKTQQSCYDFGSLLGFIWNVLVLTNFFGHIKPIVHPHEILL